MHHHGGADVETTLRAFVARHRLAGTRGILAVSGGPDSIALLHGMMAVRRRRNLALAVLHVNHHLRGKDSDADADFVADVCRTYDLPHLVHDDRETCQHGHGVEARARQVRYQALMAYAQSEGAAWAAVAHTADDQVETVLHHFLRGSGWRGWRGMRPSRRLCAGVRLLRPLLRLPRPAVVAYLTDRGYAYRIDHSNVDPRFTRNRLRHQLLPSLRQMVDPDIDRRMLALAEVAAEQEAALAWLARRILPRVERPRLDRVVVLDARRLARWPVAVVTAALRRLWRREGWPLGRMSARRWRELAGLLTVPTGRLDLPGPVRAVRVGAVLQLHPADQPTEE